MHDFNGHEFNGIHGVNKKGATTELSKKIGLGWILPTINFKPSPTSVFKWKNFKSLSEIQYNNAEEARFSLHCGFVHYYIG